MATTIMFYKVFGHETQKPLCFTMVLEKDNQKPVYSRRFGVFFMGGGTAHFFSMGHESGRPAAAIASIGSMASGSIGGKRGTRGGVDEKPS